MTHWDKTKEHEGPHGVSSLVGKTDSKMIKESLVIDTWQGK